MHGNAAPLCTAEFEGLQPASVAGPAQGQPLPGPLYGPGCFQHQLVRCKGGKKRAGSSSPHLAPFDDLAENTADPWLACGSGEDHRPII